MSCGRSFVGLRSGRVRSVLFGSSRQRRAKQLCAYLRTCLLFSLRAETPSLWTNTFRNASAPPQNHFYHWARQYTLTKGLKRPGPHASTCAELTVNVHRWDVGNSALIHLWRTPEMPESPQLWILVMRCSYVSEEETNTLCILCMICTVTTALRWLKWS